MCLLESTKSECQYYFGVIGWSVLVVHGVMKPCMSIMMNQRTCKVLAGVDSRPMYSSNQYHFYIRQQSQNN